MAGKSSSGFYVQLLLISSLASRLLLCSAVSSPAWCPFQQNRGLTAEFKQRSRRFWEFEEKTSRWVEIGSPYDLISCAGETCTKVGSIESLSAGNSSGSPANGGVDWDRKAAAARLDRALPIRKRMSITAMSEASMWATGQSGAIYERFWNGVMWVMAPHELPASAGPAISVFIVNQTILALSEAGLLYQVLECQAGRIKVDVPAAVVAAAASPRRLMLLVVCLLLLWPACAPLFEATV